MFHTHYPARGRKRHFHFGWSASSASTVSYPLPRKGTETPQRNGAVQLDFRSGRFHTHYPARGRKHHSQNRLGSSVYLLLFHTPYPARGRKPKSSNELSSSSPSSFRFIPITPQGDGNLMRRSHLTVRSAKCFTPITPQGDGN